ncbi:MAG: Uma2 family endonuclease [Bryobacterales bacterium]|nr:Uma2 family endonuclease [Bryobacterales bacterium]
MAALPSALSIEQYLRTSYEWEPEYEDGHILDRPLPSEDHAIVVDCVADAFRHSGANLFVLPQLRIRVGAGVVRIPDLSIYADERPKSGNTKPPLAVVEVVSPDDRYPILLNRLADLSGFGITYLWLISPEQRLVQRYDRRSLVNVDALEIPERGLIIPAERIFADL